MTISKKPDAILFDWDGTLVDTIHSLLKAYNDVFAHLDMPLWTMDDAKKNIRISARELFPKMFGDRSDEAMQVFYASIEKNHLELLGVMKGAEKFLSDLRANGILLGIISNKRDVFLKKEITYLGWDNIFSSVIGAGRAMHDKPAPDCMKLALEEMGLPKTSELWYIGDTDTDMEFAANVGCKKAFISHGFGIVADAEKYSPELVVGSLEELWKGLEPLFNLR